MTSPSNSSSPNLSSTPFQSEPNLPGARVRSPERTLASSALASERRSRNASPSLSAVFSSTSSRNASPASQLRAENTPSTAASRTPNAVRSPGRSPRAGTPQSEPPNPYRDLILRSFTPNVAVLASTDVEELLAEKGIPGGFVELLRPFGQRILGRITIRDSTGASKSWDNFAVHFTKLGDGLHSARPPDPTPSSDPRSPSVNGYLQRYLPELTANIRTGGDVGYVEDLVARHIDQSEQNGRLAERHASGESASEIPTSPFHLLYLRRLLSAMPLTPHETFSHPVACVIAISSRNPDPIDELRQLYASGSTGDRKLPPWASNDYLRYYVLLHDEDHDDITKSTALFEQMKRHFGLHCHLLRLRSIQCVASDDDCSRLPSYDWMSASEDLAEIERRESFEAIDDADPTPCLFDSDASAIRAFVREMVSQSIVPLMERLAATWNDQVASRRRGLSGKFLSLSKKWTPFGGSSKNSSGSNSPGGSSGGNSNSNYDANGGFYRSDVPEAIMRKLADYAFMLRDFKLAQSTYEIIRTDYQNDKAWKHHAGAAEMSALSTLLMSPSPASARSSRGSETVEQLLETASYGYMKLCGAPYPALRTLAVAIELLRPRGGTAIDDIGRWGYRIMELELAGPIGLALVAERISDAYAARTGTGSIRLHWGSRTRKAALWSVLAVDAWVRLGKYAQASAALAETVQLYRDASTKANAMAQSPDDTTPVHTPGPTALAFEGMHLFTQHLRDTLAEARNTSHLDTNGTSEAGDAEAEGTSDAISHPTKAPSTTATSDIDTLETTITALTQTMAAAELGAAETSIVTHSSKQPNARLHLSVDNNEEEGESETVESLTPLTPRAPRTPRRMQSSTSNNASSDGFEGTGTGADAGSSPNAFTETSTSEVPAILISGQQLDSNGATAGTALSNAKPAMHARRTSLLNESGKLARPE